MKSENLLKHIPLIIISALCIFHFIFLLHFFSPAVSTPDAQGYFAQGKIIAKYGHSYFTPQNNLQYLGPHWYSLDGQKYFTTFPPGFPCLIAVAYKLFGVNSVFLINLILASLSLAVFFFLCKNWLSNNWSLAAAFFLAINPFYNEHALFGDSHISLIFFFLMALLFLLKTIKTRNFIYGILAGLAIGIVPAIRYAEFALFFVFGGYILWLFLAGKISAKTLVSIVIGALMPLFTLAMHNQMAFGKFWATGYGSSTISASFGFNYLIEHFVPFLAMLVTNGMGILFPLSIIGFIILLKNTATRPITVYLLSSTVILTLLYMGYMWPPDPQSMRLLLPTFPIYTLAAVYFIGSLRKKYKIAILSIVILVSLPWGVLGSLRAVKPLDLRNSVLQNITEIIENNIKEGSIIITNEGICQNLDVYDKWKLIDISILSKSDTTLNQRPMKPIRNKFASKLYAPLSGCAFKDQVIEDLHQWSRNKIYLISYENDVEILKDLIGDRFAIDTKALIEMADFDLPVMPVRKELTHNNKAQIPDYPVGPNYIFDFEIRKGALAIVELTIK